jgi:hypothetical protein
MHKTHDTPEIAPIDHDPTQFLLTPLANPLPHPELNDLLDDFVLDAPLEAKPSNRRRRARREARASLGLPMFRLDCELERIVEEEASEIDSNLSSDSDCFSEEADEDEEDMGNTLSSCAYVHWALRAKSRDYSLRDTEDEQQSTIDISIVDYSEAISRFAKNPKAETLRKMREI